MNSNFKEIKIDNGAQSDIFQFDYYFGSFAIKYYDKNIDNKMAFEHECEVFKNNKSKYIIKFYDTIETEDKYGIILELSSKGSLYKFLKWKSFLEKKI